jgi:hypothetical protein
LTRPLEQKIQPQAHSKLQPSGGYLAQHAKDYKLEAIISFQSAHTHVAGNLDVKPGHGWATVSTTSIEGLNVLDVLTADRVVGQIITEHPLVGYVPRVSFLGTRFENLRIAGHPVDLEIDTNILGAKPAEDAPYTVESGVISRVSAQYNRIGEQRDLPSDLAEGYNRLAANLGKAETVECSLVNQAAGGFPGACFGHIIHVPEFGTITLGKLTLQHEGFISSSGVPKKTTIHLTMIDLKLGCVATGHGGVGGGSTNGTTEP